MSLRRRRHGDMDHTHAVIKIWMSLHTINVRIITCLHDDPNVKQCRRRLIWRLVGGVGVGVSDVMVQRGNGKRVDVNNTQNVYTYHHYLLPSHLVLNTTPFPSAADPPPTPPTPPHGHTIFSTPPNTSSTLSCQSPRSQG